MDERPMPSEASLAREIFGPLGGIVECGASLRGETAAEFVAIRRTELDRILAAVRDIGRFRPETMEIVDQLGYLREHDIPVTSLLLWSGCIEEFSPELGGAEAVRRMARMGADLQLTHLLQALVGTASFRARDVEASAATIVEVLETAAVLGSPAHARTASEVFLMWRAAFLPGVLMPASNSPEAVKRSFRAYAHTLEAALDTCASGELG
ncbi:hypothetical protein M8Z33_06460 [Streptomyces sp. ZAF1911]|uniref:hypothetical protein n=1 Tax=Streptomyces sp. ZAF1911 TaxID=2944129 RepID=UPI00237ADAAF|nr:hypothetical protein [Streptomyces sp. ZAF1911]MDD9376316.1 hypothetical protein [Streptomyces sp. ZAF1911]